MAQLTNEEIENAIAKEEYLTVGVKTTLCVLTSKNGFEIVGTSSCVDPANYDFELGKKYAREKAIEKVWELEGYLVQNK